MTNNFIVKYFKIITIVLCSFIILPYFLACRYIHPFFDDFYFADKISSMGAVNFVKYFYSNWTGRYSELILMVCTNVKIKNTGNLEYGLFGAFTLISIAASLFFVVHVLLKSYFSLLKKGMIALLVFTFYLVFMPELFSAFYWHCSSYYQLSLSFLIVNIGLIIQLFTEEKGWGYKTGILLLTIFIAGFSEVIIFSFGLVYLAIVLHQYFKYKKIKTFWLLLLVTFGAFALMNICSPGNMVRVGVSASKSTHHSGLVFSSLRAIYDLVLFHGYYTFFKTPFLFLCILFMPNAIRFIRSGNPVNKIFNVHPLFSILVTVIVFYLHHVLTLVAAGYSLQGRVLNFSIFLFWLAIAYNLLVVLNYFSEKLTAFDRAGPQLVSKLMLLLLILFFNFSDNNRLLLGDLTRELPAFQKQLTERYTMIENAKRNGATEVEVPFVKAIPKLYIFGEEAKCKDSSFVNEQKYLNETGLFFGLKIRNRSFINQHQ